MFFSSVSFYCSEDSKDVEYKFRISVHFPCPFTRLKGTNITLRSVEFEITVTKMCGAVILRIDGDYHR